MTTLLVSGEQLAGASVSLEGDPFRHLFRARRLGRGEALRVVDGRGGARWATVTAVGRRRAELRLGDAAPANEPSRALAVWVAPPRPGRAAWLVEKLTEVGAQAIHLWRTERAPRRYGSATLERLRRVAAAAVEQCERSRLPEIEARSWDDGIELLAGCGRRWLLTPGAPAPVPLAPGDADPVALLVGPEGGWTERESALLEALPCRPVGLGPTVLRVETAAVVGAALALVPGGDPIE